MSLPETGKQRAARIPLDYFKQPDRLERWKRYLLGAGVILPTIWLLSGYLESDQGRLRYSRGPVADVHAMWDSSCTACHESFTPIKETWATSLWGNVQACNQRCETCHAGPAHHANQTPALACASCHREHRGRDASLISRADSDCTQCHTNLTTHTTHGTPGFANSITRFDRDHPPFKRFDPDMKERALLSKATDPGRLKFNHKLHMTLGLVLQKGGEAFTISDIMDKDERERYRRQQPENERGNQDTVRLDCASCHQLDGGAQDVNPLLTPARSVGQYMLPIAYENACRACHSLTFDARLPNVAVPHRLQPDAVRSFLWGAYATQLANPKPPNDPIKRLRPGWPTTEEERKLRDEIVGKVRGAEKFLYREELQKAEAILYPFKQTCGECHHYEKTPPEDVVPKGILPPKVPNVWLPHGVFDHAAHRAVDCRECHERAYADSGKASTDARDVLIPGIDNCRQCHAPPTHSGGMAHGGARFNCTECHRYHNGDHPLQGIGARSRDAKDKLKVQQFLKGAPGK